MHYIESLKRFGSSVSTLCAEAEAAGDESQWLQAQEKLLKIRYWLERQGQVTDDYLPADLRQAVVEHSQLTSTISSDAVALVHCNVGLLFEFAYNSRHACRARFAGKINAAQRYETAAQASYNALNPAFRW